jgi:ATP-dependent DNA helicase
MRFVGAKVNNMKLQNTVMQLRKVCSHPFLFDWPTNPPTGELIVSDHALVGGSGKMMVLERLLVALFERGHKVLLFSQFTTMLDVIEEWAGESKGWKLCRIDGQTPPEDRRGQMHAFQKPGSDIQLFLLSTRAGGLGINLTAADTVIFYDQDWVRHSPFRS